VAAAHASLSLRESFQGDAALAAQGQILLSAQDDKVEGEPLSRDWNQGAAFDDIQIGELKENG